MKMEFASTFFLHFSLLFCILLLLLSSTFRHVKSVDPFQLNDDVLGLIVFKSAVEDPFSHLKSWNEDDNSPCSWEFIKCNPNNGRVSELSLDGLGLSGKIGRGLEKLEELKVLSLTNNNFSGSISDEIAAFISGSGLQRLNLSRNSLSGNVPTSFANFSKLQFLDLSENSLSGPLPGNLFGNCESLRFVSLSNNFLEGPIPSVVRCASLNHLNFSSNGFSGDPDFLQMFKALSRLRTLDLSHNSLSGEIPFGISTIHNLKEFLLKGNHFSGKIPADIGFCPHLSKLDVSGNFFTGELPDSMQMLTALTLFSLSNNMITGSFPQWINKMISLEHADFAGNSFEGSMPLSMGELKSLKFLSLSDNKLSGIIPESLGNCTGLSVLRMRGNTFNGSIPEGLFDLGLDEIDLSRNELSGPIPQGSSKLFESLQVLDISKNNLTGHFPAEMGLFSKLKYLNLSWNSFQSRLPPEIGYFQNLTVLDLRHSSLIGTIPGDICESGSLGILQLDGNLLNGPIPNEIGNCSSLYLLSLSYNSLTGPIPESISFIKKLKILKLEFNQLSGEIPQDLGKLENLLAVNISYNRLVGRLPAGSVFQTLDESAMEGNLGICSPLLKGPCKLNVPKPLVLDPYAYGNQAGGDDNQGRDSSRSFTTRVKPHRFLSVSAIVAISAAVVIAFGVMVVSFVNASARRRLAFVDTALESMCSSSTRSGSLATGKLVLFDTKSSPDWINTTLESMLNKAAEIGEGVFGTVYKASLGEGRVVAIKKLVTANILEYPDDFDREVRVLGKARHTNLISLRGYYWTPQLQVLVTDYASEGSLHSKLHQRSTCGTTTAAAPLSWPTRFKIILGTAKGLAHLHHGIRPPIIHYNIKPSNILLDEHMNPKIADFGLARLLTKLEKHVINSRFQSSLGYVAPELACQSLRVNEKCDVFGFGVLILEVVTGRRPVEYGEDNVVILSDHVRVMLEQGNVLDCVDQSMGKFPDEEVLPVLKLALVCTSQIPSSRPSMTEVVQILQVIKTPIPNRMEPF